jgi:hypothetical protein
MNPSLTWRELPVLLRGDDARLNAWTDRVTAGSIGASLAMVVVGAGLGGAAMGAWRSPDQALVSAIKLPLILLLTTLGNGLLNGLLAPLLGLNIGFRQSTLAILFSFAIAAVILGGFSPLILFLVWNLPPMSAIETRATGHAALMVSQVAVIAFAGIAANVRLLRLLQRMGGARVGWRVLFAWLAGNFLLGTQLTWMARPFFGSPGLEVQFLRPDALRGNFFEAVGHALSVLFTMD